ncbi:glycoside hydrolase family 2 TIM barrel-domain containing protein [soil metagenome]
MIKNTTTSPASTVWRIPASETGPCPAEIRARLVVGIPAHVPGAVHQSLLAAGLIPDPFFADNAGHLGWIEELHWILEIHLGPVSASAGQPVDLVLDGVDTYASIFLNDQAVGVTNNAFLKYTFPLSALEGGAANRLRLEFQPLAEAVGPSPKIYPCAFMHPLRAHVRRMQCTFGWDWVHPFVTFGLANIPELIAHPEVVFPAVMTAGIASDSAQMEARWSFGSLPDGADCDIQITIHTPSGELLTTQIVPLREGSFTFKISHPYLWYPAGYGAQPLYRASFTPVRGGAKVGREVSLVFGIRETELLTELDTEGSEAERLSKELAEFLKRPPEQGREFGFRINGVDFFALGGNWVPCDPFPGPVVEERKKQILRRFAQAGGNALRVWGGGIYESRGFYDTCAELGIVVLQDFMMACSDYPAEDPIFMAKLAPEIDQVVQRLRGHTAIIHWYGDNENAMFDGEHAPGRAWFEIAENLMRPAIAKHDVSRSFTPSCPFFGTPSTNPLQGDSHISVAFTEDRGFLLSDMKDYKQQFDGTVGRFVSEHALFGAPDVESLVRFMPEDRLDVPALWELHTRDNPSRPPGVEITLFQSLETMAAKLLGAFTDGSDRLRKLAYVHHEAVRLAVEAARRKQPFCRGLIFWMLNDCWPSSGWSLIDYYARPKASFYGFRQTSRPVHCSFRLLESHLEVWVSNNSSQVADRTVNVLFEDWSGKKTILGNVDISVAQGASQAIFQLDPAAIPTPQDGVFLAECGPGEGGWYFHGMPFEMTPPPTVLDVRAALANDGSILCQVTARSYARVVTLRGVAVADDNYFDLRAGETRSVRLEFDQGVERSALFFKPWNGSSAPINLNGEVLEIPALQAPPASPLKIGR